MNWSCLVSNILGVAPSWIEALSTLGLAILPARTLYVLRDYAADTKTLAKTSLDQAGSLREQVALTQKQLAESQTPFVVLVKGPAESTTAAQYLLENQGSGPAVNVEGWIQWWMGPKTEIPRQSIGHGATVPLGSYMGIAQAQIHYQSIDGRKFETMRDVTGQTHFIRTPPVG